MELVPSGGEKERITHKINMGAKETKVHYRVYNRLEMNPQYHEPDDYTTPSQILP
jgi:hypothetical protein